MCSARSSRRTRVSSLVNASVADSAVASVSRLMKTAASRAAKAPVGVRTLDLGSFGSRGLRSGTARLGRAFAAFSSASSMPSSSSTPFSRFSGTDRSLPMGTLFLALALDRRDRPDAEAREDAREDAREPLTLDGAVFVDDDSVFEDDDSDLVLFMVSDRERLDASIVGSETNAAVNAR